MKGLTRTLTRTLKRALYGAALCALGAVVHAQQRGGTPQTDQQPPINSGANPYRVIRDWAQITLENRAVGRLERCRHRSKMARRSGPSTDVRRARRPAVSAAR